MIEPLFKRIIDTARFVYNYDDEVVFRKIGKYAIIASGVFMTFVFISGTDKESPYFNVLIFTTIVLGSASGLFWVTEARALRRSTWFKGLCRGSILDYLLPPDEADHRILELDEAMDRWILKYGRKQAEILYAWQSLVSAALFWFDRVVVKVLARK